VQPLKAEGFFISTPFDINILEGNVAVGSLGISLEQANTFHIKMLKKGKTQP
jgi:hypothetical protein